MNLYEIQQDYRQLASDLEHSDGELTPEMEQRLALNTEDWHNKAEAYCCVIAELEHEAVAIKNEEGRLKKLRDQKETTITRLRQKLCEALAERGGYLATNLFMLSNKTTKAVELQVDPQELPALYQRSKLTISADKDALRAALMAGTVINGVKLVTNTHVVIR